jgi:hypothetical protein
MKPIWWRSSSPEFDLVGVTDWVSGPKIPRSRARAPLFLDLFGWLTPRVNWFVGRSKGDQRGIGPAVWGLHAKKSTHHRWIVFHVHETGREPRTTAWYGRLTRLPLASKIRSGSIFRMMLFPQSKFMNLSPTGNSCNHPSRYGHASVLNDWRQLQKISDKR